MQTPRATSSAAAVAVSDPVAAIALDGAARSFGSVRALKPLTLMVRPGEMVALLGLNGAGKTTAISMMLGLLEPDSGSVRLFGLDPAAAIDGGRVDRARSPDWRDDGRTCDARRLGPNTGPAGRDRSPGNDRWPALAQRHGRTVGFAISDG